MQHHDGDEAASVSTALQARIRQAIADAGGWLPFDRFMAMALYEPGLGYYANQGRKFGRMPGSGSDFVTAPELSPLFGAALAVQLRQALDASGSDELWEFGAGSGALAEQLLAALGERLRRYTIVDLSGVLRERQRERLVAHAHKLSWADRLPGTMHGVVVGNEVLDAMPVQLMCFDGERWLERGVVACVEGFAWQDRPGGVAPPGGGPFAPGYLTERQVQAQAFVATLAARLERGAAFFIDYGFPQTEYYHPQRAGGTLMCHRAHRADADPLADVGLKDITAHIDFSALALAGQDAGFEVLGYTSQARFLFNCGLVDAMAKADLRERADALKLVAEHEMGELFKVVGFARGASFDALGFGAGDRCHTL